MLSNEETMLTDDEILAQWSGSDEAVRPVMGSKKVLSFARAILAAHTAKLLAGVEKTEPVEFWTVAHGWVKVDEVKQHFDSVGCATIYAKEGEEREPLYTQDQLQQYAAAAAAQARMKALDEAMLAVNSGVLGHGECAAAIESLKGGE